MIRYKVQFYNSRTNEYGEFLISADSLQAAVREANYLIRSIANVCTLEKQELFPISITAVKVQEFKSKHQGGNEETSSLCRREGEK